MKHSQHNSTKSHNLLRDWRVRAATTMMLVMGLAGGLIAETMGHQNRSANSNQQPHTTTDVAPKPTLETKAQLEGDFTIVEIDAAPDGHSEVVIAVNKNDQNDREAFWSADNGANYQQFASQVDAVSVAPIGDQRGNEYVAVLRRYGVTDESSDSTRGRHHDQHQLDIYRANADGLQLLRQKDVGFIDFETYYEGKVIARGDEWLNNQGGIDFVKEGEWQRDVTIHVTPPTEPNHV